MDKGAERDFQYLVFVQSHSCCLACSLLHNHTNVVDCARIGSNELVKGHNESKYPGGFMLCHKNSDPYPVPVCKFVDRLALTYVLYYKPYALDQPSCLGTCFGHLSSMSH